MPLDRVLLDSAPLLSGFKTSRYLLTRRWDRPSPPIHLQNHILRYTTLRDTKRLATVKSAEKRAPRSQKSANKHAKSHAALGGWSGA
ncbi:hypothetical protein DFP72DRAFT_1182707 [Ephemerocybe angulata]|uniref:Uncharacterized protein n=1 Tax=Ephemerocybe angulata TaxID=980116 RepID=A0A8H6H5G9_9AGAR|nr:hypothetical protein DFP72DRAFT_1182707 [Tulosesus angulatus]